MTDRVLVIGSSPCEESLCWSLAQSPHIKQVLFAPGKDSTPDSGKVCKSAVLTSNWPLLKQFCKDHNISLVVISPIPLLTAGLVDDISASGVKCFGPTAKAALLQANKSNAKCFMQQYGIPTARWKSFTNPHEACHFITYTDFPVLVVKTCVFTSGECLYVTRDKDEACRAVQHLTKDWIPGDSAVPLIVEEFLQGLFGAKIKITARGPVVLGFRCTFQELDNQVISPLLNCDLYEVIQKATEGSLSSYLPVWGQSTSLSYPFLKQRNIQARHRDPEEFLDMTKMGKCETIEEAVSSSKEAMRSVVAFPGAIYSKADGPSDIDHQHTERSNPQIPNETHVAADSASHHAEIGSKALMNIYQTGKTVCSFEVNTARYKDPVFLCTTNSTGNKIKVAQACSLHRLAAQDLVTVCMNDLLSQGAQTLFFMPYFAYGKLHSEVAESVLEGLSEGCKTTGSSMLDALCWKIPPVYSWLYKEGGLSEKELVSNFSCGLGAMIIAQRTMAQQILVDIQQEEEAWLVGGLIQNTSDFPCVRVSHLLEALKINTFQLLRNVILKRTPAKISKAAVFISNTGMKLKILIDTLRQLNSNTKLALVISNKSAIEELRKAVAAGIPTRVIDHTLFTCHSDFENTICKVLDEFSIDVICLAGFGRMLSEHFLEKWKGYRGSHIHDYLDYVEPAGERHRPKKGGSSSPGPTVLQETILADSEVPVTEHIEEAEPRAVAKALHLVSSGILHLGADNHISWRTED
ncbi:trifunctional purine biosynthetic protein adenosine-3-like [Aquarana catesbeiana]|uniref:trifunctional purine biosynthetic protein adenosine-3-like n=1 Tax=Aquarana catesbeiana TaxID=8400 RepID=UPI003CCA2A7B